jgi:hypothetical protein
MKAFHILAKVTYGIGQAATVEQRHFFVKALSHSEAIQLAEQNTGISLSSTESPPEIQYTVKSARELRHHGDLQGEVFAL